MGTNNLKPREWIEAEKEVSRWGYDQWSDEIESESDSDRLYMFGEIIADSDMLTESEKVRLLDRIHRLIEQIFRA